MPVPSLWAWTHSDGGWSHVDHFVKFDLGDDAFDIPASMASRFSYDAATKRLIFRGFKSKTDFDKLCALRDSWAYRRAIDELFQLCSSMARNGSRVGQDCLESCQNSESPDILARSRSSLECDSLIPLRTASKLLNPRNAVSSHRTPSSMTHPRPSTAGVGLSLSSGRASSGVHRTSPRTPSGRRPVWPIRERLPSGRRAWSRRRRI